MNRRQLITLLVLVSIIGGAGLAVYKRNSSTWEGNAEGAASGKVLGDFALNDIGRVVIKTNASTLTLAKKNDAWVVRERDDYPADFARVGNFIQQLWQLKPVQDVEVGPSQLGRLDLVTPGAGAAEAGTLVDLQNSDSKRIAALLLGKQYLKQAPQAPDQESYPAGRYVMIPDSTPPAVSLVSEILDQADPDPALWLDKTFLHIDRIQSVALANGSTSWEISRDNDSASDWKLANPQPGEKLDPGKVPSFVAILGAPSFTDVLPVTTKRNDLDTAVTVRTFDQFAYTLKFGKADGDKLPMAIDVTAALPAQRIPGKDEKPDDKKRLDSQFAADNKRLSDSLAKVKTFEPRVYLVSNSIFSPLFKSRADLLAPKPAPSATPSPSPTAPRPAPVTVTTPPISAFPQASPAKSK